MDARERPDEIKTFLLFGVTKFFMAQNMCLMIAEENYTLFFNLISTAAATKMRLAEKKISNDYLQVD